MAGDRGVTASGPVALCFVGFSLILVRIATGRISRVYLVACFHGFSEKDRFLLTPGLGSESINIGALLSGPLSSFGVVLLATFFWIGKHV